LADDVTQATTPLITSPTHLDPEAMKPASTDDIMDAINRASSAPMSAPRRRGRPPGSKNKTPLQRAAALNPELATAAEEEAKREAKKKRVEQIESQILNELNDQLMTLVMGAWNVPVSWLYLPGKEPSIAKVDTRFTELGNALAIPPNLAHSIGRLAAELEQTDIGSKVGGIAQNNNVGLIVAGGMTIFGVMQYAKKITDTLDKVKQMKEAYGEWLQQQGNDNQPPMTSNEAKNSGSVA
jgi:hypothetical protein